MKTNDMSTAAPNRHTCMTCMTKVNHTSHTFHTNITCQKRTYGENLAPNSYGQTWIRITSICINDMRTISAQVADSKQRRKFFFKSVIVYYITSTALVVKPPAKLGI